MAEYHAQNGFTYERDENGHVHLRAAGGNSAVLTPSEWASVIASVCADGENAQTYQDALSFHMDRRPPQVVGFEDWPAKEA